MVCSAGVWKGLFARIIMIGTLTALQWFIYDSVKVYFRLPRPPPPEMPESLKKKLGLTEQTTHGLTADCPSDEFHETFIYLTMQKKNKALYNVIIGCALSSHEGLNSTTVIA